MEGLSSFLSPSCNECKMATTDSIYKFCFYICSKECRLEEIDYWTDINKLLCLVQCSHAFLQSITGIPFSLDIDPLLKSCTKMINFCMAFLDSVCMKELSFSRQIYIYLLTSFLRGLYEVDGFLSLQLISMSRQVVNIDHSSDSENVTSVSYTSNDTTTNRAHLLHRNLDENLELGDSPTISGKRGMTAISHSV